jgi:hypothetical protein
MRPVTRAHRARAPSQRPLDHTYFYKIIEARDFLKDMPREIKSNM